MNYYSVGVDIHEAMLRSRDFAEVCKDTESYRTIMGSDEDPKLYVLYDTVKHRNAAFEAFRDVFSTAQLIYGPHYLEE